MLRWRLQCAVLARNGRGSSDVAGAGAQKSCVFVDR